MGSFLWMSSGRGLNESLLIVPTTPAAAATSSHLRPPPPRPTTRPHRLAQGSERTSSSGPGETLGPRRPSGRAGRAGPREPRGMPRSGGWRGGEEAGELGLGFWAGNRALRVWKEMEAREEDARRKTEAGRRAEGRDWEPGRARGGSWVRVRIRMGVDGMCTYTYLHLYFRTILVVGLYIFIRRNFLKITWPANVAIVDQFGHLYFCWPGQ